MCSRGLVRDRIVALRERAGLLSSQLAELQSRQSISHGPRFPLQQPIPKGGLGQLPMPPMDIVVNLLKRVRGSSDHINFATIR